MTDLLTPHTDSEPLAEAGCLEEARPGSVQPSFARRLALAFWDLAETVVPAIVIALVINLLLAQTTRVLGHSMQPNLEMDQRLVVEKLSYRFQEPARGDVVVLWPPYPSDKPLIKRVIGLPGETVRIADGQIFIDDVPLQEPYIDQETYWDDGEHRVPPQQVFVLGDNRSASNDSRFFGMVPYDSIVGKAWLSYWPSDRLGWIE
jgi:signal peptidase I